MNETLWQVLALVLPVALVIGCNWWAWRRRTSYEEYRKRHPERDAARGYGGGIGGA